MKFLQTILFSSLLGLAPIAAQAEELFSNLGHLSLGQAGMGPGGKTAVRFTTPTDEAAYALDQVVMRLGDSGTPPNFSVSLYSNVDNRPGVLIETLSGPSSPVTLQDYTYSSAGALLLAGTQYWIVGSNADGWAYWRWTSAGASVGALQSYSGNNWQNADGNLQFSLSATPTAVPEPATYPILAGIAVLGLACVRRRHLRASI